MDDPFDRLFDALTSDEATETESPDPNEAIAESAAQEIAAGPNGTEDIGENIFDGCPPSHREATVFDIETESLPEEDLADLIPVFADFDASTVKVGNIKDRAKIEEKIEAARLQHKADQGKARAKFIDRAALSSLTGRVVAIGYLRGDGRDVLDVGETAMEPSDPVFREGAILEAYWKHYRYCRQKKTSLIGFNSNGFDLPFLIHRSWKHRIEVPSTVLVGRYFDKTFVDLMLLFGCGKFNHYVSLDAVARFLGVGGKPDNCTGADFAKLLASENPDDRKAALDYLRNDLTMTWGVAAAMGVVQPLPKKTPSQPQPQPKEKETPEDGTTQKES